MRKHAKLIVVTVLLTFSLGCGTGCSWLNNEPSIPTQIPETIVIADNNVMAGAAYALGVINSLDEVVNQISLIEDTASKEGAVPASADSIFDSAILAYADTSDTAVAKILQGVDTWDELRTAIDPLLEQVNALLNLGSELAGIQTRLEQWWTVLRELAVQQLAELLTRSAIPSR